MLQRLKQATQADHAALEAASPLLDPQLNRATYRWVLERFYGMYAPLEQELLPVLIQTCPGINWSQRRKTPLLIRDLAALGVAAEACAALPRCSAVPTINTLPQALGCAYVLEGATLGGQVIVRQVGPRLGLTPSAGCAFFASYGPDVGHMWRSFQAAIRTNVTSADAEAALIASAQTTFKLFEQWLGARHAAVSA